MNELCTMCNGHGEIQLPDDSLQVFGGCLFCGGSGRGRAPAFPSKFAHEEKEFRKQIMNQVVAVFEAGLKKGK